MISLENVCYKVKDKVILDNINIDIYEDEITFIIGASGAGKTSLLNLIGGLEKISSGKIRLDDVDISEDLSGYRARNVGFVFQDYNLITGMNAYDNIRLAMNYSGTCCETIEDEIETFNIKDPLQKCETMSGGEKQRIAILRSICKNCKIILGDEPTGNLDPANSYKVCEELTKIKKGRHIVIVTHNVELAYKFGDRIITIGDGRIISDEPNENVKNKVVDSIASYKEKFFKRNGKKRANTMVAINGLKRRFIRLSAISLIIAIAVSVNLLSYILNNFNDMTLKKLNLNFLESDLITVFMNDDYYIKEANGFFDKDIEELTKKYDIVEYVPIYVDYSKIRITDGVREEDITLKQINIDSFFENRIMSDEINGKFLKNKYDMIIAYDIAEKLFGTTKCIGRKVSVICSPYRNNEYTIVGVNFQTNAEDKVNTYVSSESFKDVFSEHVKRVIFTKVELKESNVDKKENGILAGTISKTVGNEEIIYGKQASSDDEIYIDENIINIMFRKDITPEQWYEKYKDETLLLGVNGWFKVKIAGIVKTKTPSFYISPKYYELMQEARPIELCVYVKDPRNVGKIKDDINKYVDYSAVVTSEKTKEMVMTQNISSRSIIEYLGWSLLLIAGIVMIAFIVFSVTERKHEIGIIKSLGANIFDIVKILMADVYFIIVSSSIMICIFVLFMLKMLPRFFAELEIVELIFPTKAYFIAIGMTFLVTSISVLFGMIKLITSSCAKLLR